MATLCWLPGAAQRLDSLSRLLQEAKHDTARCGILKAMIAAENDDALWPKYNAQLLSTAERNLKKLPQDHPLHKVYKFYAAHAMFNEGSLAHFQGDNEKALEIYERVLKLQTDIRDTAEIAGTLNNIGGVYLSKGDIPRVLGFWTTSLAYYEQVGDKKSISALLNNMASVYNSQGDVARALECFGRSMKIREALGNKVDIAESLNNIANIYSAQGDYRKALDNYSKAYKIFEEAGDRKRVAIALNNMGFIYQRQGDPSVTSSREDAMKAGIAKALDLFARSMKIREEIGDKRGIAHSCNSMGAAYRLLHNQSAAMDYFRRALQINEETGNKEGIAYTLNNIGNTLLDQKNYSAAEDYLSRSLTIGRELGFPESIRNAARSLFILHKATGNYKAAFENFQLFIQMRDSLSNLETQKASIRQQAQYEYEKKKAIEDEKHAAELKVQEEKAQADRNRQYLIISGVSLILVLVAVFSALLYSRYRTTQKQKLIIEEKEKETLHQKHIIEEKQKEIIDSINYAKRIQYSLLAHDEFLKEHVPQHFVFFRPKDIVSGDFYWAAKQNNRFYLAVCDSTGHGVPGAFMSLLSIGLLSEAINEKGIMSPNEILDYVRTKLISSVSREGQRDGFDGVLLCVNASSGEITYAAANNAPVLVHDQKLYELPADRMPVGVGERSAAFSLHRIEAKKGDTVYLYTDGYADQFGGEKGKKFKYKQLNQILLSLSGIPLAEQQSVLKRAFESWKGDLEQVDDVCVIGLRI